MLCQQQQVARAPRGQLELLRCIIILLVFSLWASSISIPWSLRYWTKSLFVPSDLAGRRYLREASLPGTSGKPPTGGKEQARISCFPLKYSLTVLSPSLFLQATEAEDGSRNWSGRSEG